MTLEEFTQKLPDCVRKPTELEYELIKIVYDHHPAITSMKGVSQIVELYSQFGMRVICDMQETARRNMEIDDEIDKLNERLAELKDEKKELAMK